MIVSHEHQFIFLKTRKTAGTSIEIALSRLCGPLDVITPVSPTDEALRLSVGGRGPQNCALPWRAYRARDLASHLLRRRRRSAFNHMNAEDVRRLVGRQVWDSYYKFTVERNPWDAAISMYYWRQRPDTPFPPPRTFTEFVESGGLQLLARNSEIYRIAGEVAVDRVCRYESLASELEEVRVRLGLPESLELPHAKGTLRTDRRPYREVLDADGALAVRQLFERQIRDFGYEF